MSADAPANGLGCESAVNCPQMEQGSVVVSTCTTGGTDRSLTTAASRYETVRNNVSAATVVRRAESLASRTTLRVGGPAEIYVEPASEEDLARLLQACRGANLPVFILGRGSNLLIRDGGMEGVVISLAQSKFSRIEVTDDCVHAGAGARLKDVAYAARRAGLAGLEFLEGIPGSVGGALRMNAGAMGASTFQRLESLRVMDPAGIILALTPAEVPVTYRSCPLLSSHLALGATWRCERADPAAIKERMDALSAKRWTSQPSQRSAGCIFKNPSPETPAGRLIEELGLKGARVGAAVVSDVHANFVVNLGGATAREVLELIALIQRRVLDARGIELQPEVEIVGHD